MVVPLQDFDVMEAETISLKLVLSKPRQVTWLRGLETISGEDSRCQIFSSDDGLEHTLTIARTSVDDSGIYAVQVDDNEYGSVTSSCSVTIKGTIPFELA